MFIDIIQRNLEIGILIITLNSSNLLIRGAEAAKLLKKFAESEAGKYDVGEGEPGDKKQNNGTRNCNNQL